MPTEKMSVRAIIHAYTNGRLSSRPEYYSGRGVNRGDLNGNHVKMVYDGVLKELGEDAAKAFVEMVRTLKDMSATGFLNSLYRLERAGWVFDKNSFNQSGDGIAATDEVTAFCTVASMFGRNSDPEVDELFSRQISNEFLALIGAEPIKSKSRYPSIGAYYADPDFVPFATRPSLSKRLR